MQVILHNILLIAIYLVYYNYVCQIILRNRPRSCKIMLSRNKKKTEIRDLYIWIMKDYMELSELNRVPLPKEKVCIYKVFVLNEFRGKRVSGAIVSCHIEYVYK